MRKAVLGMSALALVAAAAWANDQTTEESKRMAAVDTSVAAFSKLDTDGDGRVSAIEAANETNVAANFSQADADKDGYLSQAEFQSMGQASEESSPPESETATEPTP